MDSNLVALLTSLVVQLVNEFKHHTDELTPEIVQQRLEAKIAESELKIDQTIAAIQQKNK